MIRYLLPLAMFVTSAAIAAPVCDGQLVTMRLSKLKPGGTAANFAEAVKANADWYKAKGLTNDRFVSAAVMSYAGGAAKPSADQFVTMHIVGGAKAPSTRTTRPGVRSWRSIRRIRRSSPRRGCACPRAPCWSSNSANPGRRGSARTGLGVDFVQAEAGQPLCTSFLDMKTN